MNWECYKEALRTNGCESHLDVWEWAWKLRRMIDKEEVRENQNLVAQKIDEH